MPILPVSSRKPGQGTLGTYRLSSETSSLMALLSVAALLMVGCSQGGSGDGYSTSNSDSIGPPDSLELTGCGPVEFPEAEFIETATGLKYRILRAGSDRKPEPNDIVISHYKGWLDDGSIFDSSYRMGEPIDFPLNRVISGWTEGLQLVGEGGMIELDIPYSLGYGDQGSPPVIPPKARLHFVVELMKIR